jgi:hypothetical protein
LRAAIIRIPVLQRELSPAELYACIETN